MLLLGTVILDRFDLINDQKRFGLSFMSEQTLDIYSMYKNFCNFLTSALRLKNLRYASESLSRPLLMYFFRGLNLSLINCISL